jgi:hypothetical protein
MAASNAFERDARVKLHFDVERPVELVDLTLAFTSFARQYRKFTRSRMAMLGRPIADEDAHLYITRLESRSIFAELVPGSDFFGAVMTLMDYVNIMVDFARHVNDLLHYLADRDKTQRPDIDGMDCNDLHDFVELVAKNKDGRLNLEVAEYEKATTRERTVVRFTFNNHEALAAQRGAIDMLDDPYGHAYLVDVNVAHIQGVPKAYTVVRLREILDGNGDQSDSES